MNTAQEIQIILGSCMDNRDKIEAIWVLVESYLKEKNIFTNEGKIKQQVLSEILYLLEKTNGRCTEKYILNRIKLVERNCLQSGWIIPRNMVEIGCDYLENLKENQVVIEKKEIRKMQRQTGWHKKTEQRFERLLLSSSTSTRKKRRYVVQPLLAA